ncbi:MAG: methyltransferase domain-containing protein [Candidatus Competibacteraceae bacterium]
MQTLESEPIMTVKTVFDKYAASYDDTRRQLIPCFDDFYGTAVSLLPFSREQQIEVLDLGAGTGLLSAKVLGQFPNARLVLLDVSESMLAHAKIRLAESGAQVECKPGNFAMDPFTGSYEAVVSALAIHHLNATEKRELFRKAYHHIKPKGVFINADQVLGAGPAIEARYRQHWLTQVQAAGVSPATLAAALERMQEDQMSTLVEQLAWLEEAGFQDVNCWYKNYSFVVYSGTKP